MQIALHHDSKLASRTSITSNENDHASSEAEATSSIKEEKLPASVLGKEATSAA